MSPATINRNNIELTAGLRFNEPLPLNTHNTMSLGYVQNGMSSQFLSPGNPGWKREHVVELNALIDVVPMAFVQPVIQYYVNAGGGPQHAVVVGFRTKVEL